MLCTVSNPKCAVLNSGELAQAFDRYGAAHSCMLFADTLQVLPFIARMEYTTEDGASAAWCPMPIKENREKQVLTLDPGDSIFSVRVCYDPSPDQSRIIGIMFGGIARQYTCGNVWIAPERCVSSQSAVQAPLSYFDGQCSAIYVAMNNVCWNKWHRPRVLPQGELAGGRVEGAEVAVCCCHQAERHCASMLDRQLQHRALLSCVSCPASLCCCLLLLAAA